MKELTHAELLEVVDTIPGSFYSESAKHAELLVDLGLEKYGKILPLELLEELCSNNYGAAREKIQKLISGFNQKITINPS